MSDLPGGGEPSAPESSTLALTPAARRGRDRHGRGLRGPLAPRAVPIGRLGSEHFDTLVLDVIDDVERRLTRASEVGAHDIDVDALRTAIEEIEFGVEDVPSPDVVDLERGQLAALGRAEEATRDHAPRVIVYRRPLERRGRTDKALEAVLSDVLLELMLEALGIDPSGWGESDEGED